MAGVFRRFSFQGCWTCGGSRFPTDRILENYTFDRINDAIEGAARGDVIKPVLVMA
jgi:hypothetical protein